MTKPAVVDAGPLVALFDNSDRDHDRAVEFFRNNRIQGRVTTAVIAEVAHLLSFDRRVPVDFLDWIARGSLAVEELGNDLLRIIVLMEKYADTPMDFADATLVAASERLGIRNVVTLDSHFLVYRLHGKQPFRNLFSL